MDTCFTVQVVDVLCDERFQETAAAVRTCPARLPGSQDLVGAVGPRLAEMVVEDFTESQALSGLRWK